MSTRKTTLFYGLLIGISGLAVGMVLASRLDLAPASVAQTFTPPTVNSAPVTGSLDAQTFRNVAREQSPMVVNIRTETAQSEQGLEDLFGGGEPPSDLFRRFFGPPPGAEPDPDQPTQRRRRPPTTVARGTGFIISPDGLILTNNHVVDGATQIEVALYGEDEDLVYEAKVVGRDELTDTALIQLVEKPDHELPVARFGDSDQMAAGDWVIAIGNPFNFSHTVTVGVVSATERAFPLVDSRPTDMLQTDAAINPGNSGGPLLNLRGDVVGMNTMIISNGQVEGNIGIGFAIPINTIRDLLPQLHTGKVIRGRIGVQITAVPRDGYEDLGLPSREGAIVARVEPGGAADSGGIRPGDVIVEFNGHSVMSSDELPKIVTATKPGTSVNVKVIRAGKEETLKLVVEELDLAAEQGRQTRNQQRNEPAEQGGDSFGITLSNLTQQRARQLQLPPGIEGALITDVDPNGPAAGVLRAGDVILSVNRQPVSNAAEAGRTLQEMPSGRLAQILLWRGDGELFVTVRKE